VYVQICDCVFRTRDNKSQQLVIIYADPQHLLFQELSLSLSGVYLLVASRGYVHLLLFLCERAEEHKVLCGLLIYVSKRLSAGVVCDVYWRASTDSFDYFLFFITNLSSLRDVAP